MANSSRRKNSKRSQGGKGPKGRTPGGRTVPRPPWEAVWKRAAGVSSNLWWEPGVEGEPRPKHEDIFLVLDTLASADDGLGSLAAMAAVLDAAEGSCDVSAELRAVAEKTVDPSEAALFAGYVSPDSASQADASAMAGRMLRAHRERDLPDMVAAANLNPKLFTEKPLVGVLTIAPLLIYEITRAPGDRPVTDQVSIFFDHCPVPFAGAENVLRLVLAASTGVGLVVPDGADLQAIDSELESNELHPLGRLSAQMLDNRPLVDEFLEWSLEVAAVMQQTQASRSLDQCGAKLTIRFAPIASVAAVVVSENPGTRRFRKRDAPTGSLYATWRRWLELVSPKGHVHRTLGAFTPSDLIDAQGIPFRGEVVRLVNAIEKADAPLFGSTTADRAWTIPRRKTWLVRLSEVLIDQITATEVLGEFRDVLPTVTPLGPTGPTVASQELFLWLSADLEARDLQDDAGDPAGVPSTDAQETLPAVAQLLASRIESALSFGDLAPDELRGLEEWVELSAEILTSGIRKPAEDFDPFIVRGDLGRWLGQLGGWLKARGWKEAKERPEVEKIPDFDLPTPPTDVVDIAPEVAVRVLEPKAPISILYVGGNEAQARIHQAIEEHVSGRYGDMVVIEWVHINWTANWGRERVRISGRLAAGFDAIVLLPLVRTVMGEHVRRTAGDHDVPWIPCTSRGQGSAKRAIDNAVQVVCRQRLAN